MFFLCSHSSFLRNLLQLCLLHNLLDWLLLQQRSLHKLLFHNRLLHVLKLFSLPKLRERVLPLRHELHFLLKFSLELLRMHQFHDLFELQFRLSP